MAFAELPFYDSFAHYSNTTYQGKWTSLSASNFSLNNSGGRSGLNGALHASGIGVSSASLTLLGSYGHLYCGFAFKTAAWGGGNLVVYDNANIGAEGPQVSITRNGDGTFSLNVQAYNNTTFDFGVSQIFGLNGRPLSLNTWYYFEVDANIVSTTQLQATVRVNGNVEVSNLTLNLVGGAHFLATVWRHFTIYGGNTGSTSDTCDLYLTSTGFYGDGIVMLLKPTAAGNYTVWTPLAGSNWSNVNEVPPDSDTTYNSSANVGDKDSYTMSNVPTGVIIKGVQSLGWIDKDATGVASYQPLYRSGVSDQLGGTYNPSLSQYQYFREGDETSPFTGIAWTYTEVNGMEFGQQRTA